MTAGFYAARVNLDDRLERGAQLRARAAAESATLCRTLGWPAGAVAAKHGRCAVQLPSGHVDASGWHLRSGRRTWWLGANLDEAEETLEQLIKGSRP